jgi:ABC-type sugar transport system permease subunit
MSAGALAGAQAAQALAPSGPQGDKAKAIVYVLLAVAVIIVIFIVVGKFTNLFDNITGGFGTLLEKIGLKDSAEDKARKEAAAKAEADADTVDSPFNPAFYKTAPAGTTLLTQAKADTLAKQIWDSVGTLYDDPEAGFAAIKQCKNWASVSWLSDRFAAKYGRDLYNWLKIKYDTDAQVVVLTKIVNYARALPKF